MRLSYDLESGSFMVSSAGTIGDLLPGIMESIEICGALKMQGVSIYGQSGKQKEVEGWNDADVSIKLTLIDDPSTKMTRYHYLSLIVGLFKKMDKDKKPVIYTVSHPFINAWGIKQLVFSELKTSESRGRNKISVSLDFVEYKIVAALAQERASADSSATTRTKEETQQVPSGSAVNMRRLAAMERKFGYI